MKKAIKWVVVLALLASGGYWFYNAKAKKTEAVKPSYDRAQVGVRDLRNTVESTGEVAPRNRLDIKPPIAGRLEELLVDEGDRVEKGQILGWVSSTERATLLDAALAISAEEYEYWQALYKPTPLVSPLNGTVIARKYEPGQSIVANNAVVVIADDLIVVANLDETDIGQVKDGQKVHVTLEAYPDHEFFCEVEKIAYDARTVSNVTMYEVDVRPDRLPPFARSGMTANLEFIIEEKAGALTVPASAIQQKSGGSKVKASSRGEGTDPERRKMIVERMRQRGMSEAEIQERLAQFAAGGGKKGGGKKGGRKKEGVSFVFMDSGDSENPEERIVKTGISDGSYTEVLEGLEKGDEVLIQKVNLGSGTAGSGSPFMPSMRGGGRRR
jgi:macrolide-specific efflux system membrane fusion protein